MTDGRVRATVNKLHLCARVDRLRPTKRAALSSRLAAFTSPSDTFTSGSRRTSPNSKAQTERTRSEDKFGAVCSISARTRKQVKAVEAVGRTSGPQWLSVRTSRRNSLAELVAPVRRSKRTESSDCLRSKSFLSNRAHTITMIPLRRANAPKRTPEVTPTAARMTLERAESARMRFESCAALRANCLRLAVT